MQATDLSMVCEGLLSRIFRRPNADEDLGFVVALTAAHPRAGVTQITNALAAGLDQGTDRITLLLNGRGMAGSSAPDGSRGHWHTIQSELAVYLEKLRREYRYILIDCPSLREAEHAVVLGPLVDGVVLVVEANRTRRDQLSYAERTIENGGGRILGHVLNKRQYVIPDWLHNKMEAFGI